VGFISDHCHAPVPLQVVLFLIVSFLLLVFTRTLAVKYFNKNRVKTKVENLSGKKTDDNETKENIQSKGHVKVNDLCWLDRSREEEKIIEKDEVVRIIRVEGVKLIVEEEGEK